MDPWAGVWAPGAGGPLGPAGPWGPRGSPGAGEPLGAPRTPRLLGAPRGAGVNRTPAHQEGLWGAPGDRGPSEAPR